MKWINQMIDKITDKNTKLNTQFKVQKHTVVCQSGTVDYICVTIDNKDSFTFDFWTKELTTEYGCRYFEEISKAFKRIYGNISIINNFE